MLIHFWGVRGSIPAPITGQQLQNKITAVVQRLSPKDLESEEARMKFISNLPPAIFGTIGGNTACVEVRSDSGQTFILDMGSGLRSYAKHGLLPKSKHYVVLQSHFHWDHIQGLPFFDPTFDPQVKIDLYSAFPAAERILSEQSRTPYFPENASWEHIKDRFTFHVFKPDEYFEIVGVKIKSHKMHHPGNSYIFSLEENGKKFLYATDVELQPKDFDLDDPKNDIFKNVDALILDSQYTPPEAVNKANWGHSSFANAVDFASLYNVKNLYIFHHEPTYDDQKIYKILQSAKWYYESKNLDSKLNICLAVEGQEIVL